MWAALGWRLISAAGGDQAAVRPLWSNKDPSNGWNLRYIFDGDCANRKY